MQVYQIMSQPVDVISPSTTSREAARRMRDENIGSLPVGENGQLIGMVTDRDIVARAVAENALPSNTAVRTPNVAGSVPIVLWTKLSCRRRGSWQITRSAACPF